VTIIKDAVIPNGTIIWASLVQKEKDKIIQNEHRYGSPEKQCMFFRSS
jgi:hypothetical protein